MALYSTSIETSVQFEDAFSMLCGDLLGQGINRKVFECRIDPTVVVKVETDTHCFTNAREWRHWDEMRYWKKGNMWFAPCVMISPLGTVMLQKRVMPIRQGEKLPEKLPAFLTDIKPQNFGWLDGRLVCHDYPQIITVMSTALKPVTWEW